MNAITDTCLRYLDGDLTLDEAEDFDRLISTSPEAARELARCLIDEHYLAKTQSNEPQTQIDASDASAIHQAVRHLDQHEESDRVLRELLRMERDAVAKPRHTEALLEDNIGLKPDQSMAWSEVSGATLYLLGQAAKSKATPWLAAAAVFIIASIVVVMSAMQDDSAPTQPALVEAPGDRAALSASDRVVASLTAASGAVWENEGGVGGPRVGDALFAGQSLTLQQGTAQLTTQRGAIANLQAPCRVELLESDNGLRLIRGRMVGICETPSSKGFLVRTPHMDVTDLGTRFGVDVSQADTSEVHVFEGEVKVFTEADDRGIQERVISTGQAVAVQADDHRLIDVEQNPTRFASLETMKLEVQPSQSLRTSVRRMSGDLKDAPKAGFIGRAADQWPDGENAFIFQEFVGRLHAAAQVNIAEPTLTRKNPLQSQESVVDAGTKVRSFIIVAKAGSNDSSRIVKGSVSFENEIVGVITLGETALAYAALFGDSKQLFDPGTGANGWMDPNNYDEYIMLSEDLRTITFSMQVKQSSDAVRVLVKNEEADQEP